MKRLSQSAQRSMKILIVFILILILSLIILVGCSDYADSETHKDSMLVLAEKYKAMYALEQEKVNILVKQVHELKTYNLELRGQVDYMLVRLEELKKIIK